MARHDDSSTDPRADDRMAAPRFLRKAVRGLEQRPAADRLADRLEPAAGAFGRGTTGAALRGEWLGHALHPLLTDLPLGCWLSSTLLDLVGGKTSAPAARRLVGLGLLAVPVTVASGLADWDRASSDERVRRVGAVHAAGNTVVAACYLGSWWLRRSGKRGRGIVLGLLGGSLAVGTGYLGAHLSFARASGQGERGLHIATASGDRRSTEPFIDLTAPDESSDPADFTLDG
jgi:uncharacterized membrane protein